MNVIIKIVEYLKVMKVQHLKLGKCHHVTTTWLLSVFNLAILGWANFFLRVRVYISEFVSHMAITTQL